MRDQNHTTIHTIHTILIHEILVKTLAISLYVYIDFSSVLPVNFTFYVYLYFASLLHHYCLVIVEHISIKINVSNGKYPTKSALPGKRFLATNQVSIRYMLLEYLRIVALMTALAFVVPQM